ncbi:MAG: ATP-dependent DNA helicase [Chloroflexia bacterium]
MDSEEIPALLDRLADTWPSYIARPGQSQMARAVAHAIDSGLNLLVEGGTGVGKSVAYLLPVALSALQDGKRTLIATSHKHLQDQLSGKDLPQIAELTLGLGSPDLTWATLKGLPNYVCRIGLETELARSDPDLMAERVADWIEESGHHGEFDEMPFAVPGDLRSRLSTEAEECPHERCPRYGDCFAMAAARRAKAASVVITNHALLGLHLASGGHMLPGAYDTVIVDEAHAFEGAATRAYGFEASSGALRRLLYGEVTRNMAGEGLLRAAQAALARLDLEVSGRLGQEETKLRAPIGAGGELADLLNRLATDLEPDRLDASSLDLGSRKLVELSEAEAAALRASKRAASFADRLRTVCAVDDPLLVYHVEEGAAADSGLHEYTLLALPLEVGPFLEAWWERQATILTSATLSDGESFSFFSDRLGLARPHRLMVPSPFDYPNRTRLVLTPVPGQEQPGRTYYARLADQIARLMDAAGGKCLLLFTSHRALEAVWAQLQPMRIAGWRLYRQGEAPQAQLLAALRGASPDGKVAMFASRSWWQGVDLPGMRLVVMDKLPFPQLGDPLTAARSEQIERLDGQAFHRYILPLALIAFRQGFGRLMRSESDFGAVAVCDARMVTRSYAARFLEALPEDIPVLGSSDELRLWVREMIGVGRADKGW